MIKVSHSVMIDRPAKDVFAFIANPENAPQWVSGVHEVKKLSEGPMAVGAKARQVRRFMGQELGSDFEITHFEPNTRLDVKVTSGPLAGFHVAESVASAPGDIAEHAAAAKKEQAVVTFVGQGEVAGALGKLFKLAEPVLARMYERQLQADMGHLKDLLESGNA